MRIKAWVWSAYYLYILIMFNWMKPAPRHLGSFCQLNVSLKLLVTFEFEIYLWIFKETSAQAKTLLWTRFVELSKFVLKRV